MGTATWSCRQTTSIVICPAANIFATSKLNISIKTVKSSGYYHSVTLLFRALFTLKGDLFISP
jgi:hypothetical protein